MSKIQPIDEVMWAVVAYDGQVVNNTFSSTNSNSTDLFINRIMGNGYGWSYYKELGFRCIKVRVQITPFDNHNSQNLIDKKV